MSINQQIGNKYGISYNYLTKLIIQETGTNISNLTTNKTKITLWEPKNFKLENTTIWSFKNRGKWATHQGNYRGNWSPYIPRNIILRYSRPEETVLDYFVGGGTTAVEAKLLGRRCIARDINPQAINLTKENLCFQLPPNFSTEYKYYEPKLEIGDARNLSTINDESIDLICAHPPYAGIISYSADTVEGDLSTLTVTDFAKEIYKVALESYRVLRPGRQCAILIGDSRKSKHIVPIGFLTIRAFLNAGFRLRELIIKRQHNCKTTGFWYKNSIRYNFLLLAHEYLPVFEKPVASKNIFEVKQLNWFNDLGISTETKQITDKVLNDKLETTTVWIFPAQILQDEIRRNIKGRFSNEGEQIIEIDLTKNNIDKASFSTKLVYIYCSSTSILISEDYLNILENTVNGSLTSLEHDGYCVIETRDFRKNGSLIPMGLLALERIKQPELEIKEIVIVTTEENHPFEPSPEGHLGIAHKYLIIYRKR